MPTYSNNPEPLQCSHRPGRIIPGGPESPERGFVCCYAFGIYTDLLQLEGRFSGQWLHGVRHQPCTLLFALIICRYYLLDSYETGACAAKCNNALGCQAFNIYFERSPSIVPASSCPNPPGTANIFCVLWGGPISQDNARNDGQWRDQYHVVISASNGYVLTSSLSPLSGKAINAPLDCNNDDAYSEYLQR